MKTGDNKGERETGKKGIVRWLKAICGVLMTFALLANTLIILQGTFQPIREVEGFSMCPSVSPEDGLVVLPVEEKEIRAGQLVVFPDPEGYGREVVHRVVSVERAGSEYYLTTKGDNNPVPDPRPVPAGAVRGRVVFRIPGFGLFMDFLRSPYGFSLCVLCPLLLFFFCCAAESLLEERKRESALVRLLTIPFSFH